MGSRNRIRLHIDLLFGSSTCRLCTDLEFVAEEQSRIQCASQKKPHVSNTLNSSQQVVQGMIEGTTIGHIKGDTRNVDYGSCFSEASVR